MEPKLNKIKIIVPFYNATNFIDNCIVSLLTQDYPNYEVLFIDDCSTDGSYDKIPACTIKTDDAGKPVYDDKGHPIIVDKHPLLDKTKCLNVLAWRSNVRNTALRNIHNGVVNFCTDPDDICVLVDGDDALLNKHALSYINDFYNQTDCWTSWGSCIWSNGNKDFSSQYMEEEFKNIRKAPFRVSHLRSFRAGLYHSIAKQDPEFKCMKDKDDKWFLSSYDTAIYYCLLELAGFKRAKWNHKQLYLYNLHPNNDHAQNQTLQWDVHRQVTEKPAFKQIKDYKTGELL